MDLNISDEDRKQCEEDLKKGEPYSDEELEMLEFDGYIDISRAKATRAKLHLEGKI